MAGKSSVLYYITLLMTPLYALIGIYIMVSDNFDWLFTGWKKYVLGVFFILYSVYRIIRLYRINKSLNKED